VQGRMDMVLVHKLQIQCNLYWMLVLIEKCKYKISWLDGPYYIRKNWYICFTYLKKNRHNKKR
jgi:hypothetical protein